MEYTTEQLFAVLDNIHPLSAYTSVMKSTWTREDEAKFQEIKRLVANYWTQFSKAQEKS